MLAQCHVGLVALDPRHRNDNIPGKFLAYMQSGLPVLANINAGNDLEKLIMESEVGQSVTDNSLIRLVQYARKMVLDTGIDSEISARCRNISVSLFSSEAAVTQITQALTRKPE